jgi:hypothetical protein
VGRAPSQQGLAIRLANRLSGQTGAAVIWRSVIVAGYVALAILVAIAYGGRGLATLFFFYFTAGAWVVFLLVWGRAARAAGRWNFERLDHAPLPSEQNGSSPGDGEAEASEQQQVGVEGDAPATPDAKQRQPVLVL